MVFKVALVAVCGLAFAAPALAQSTGYDAVFGGGGGGRNGGLGYAEVFGASGPTDRASSPVNSRYVSPLMSERAQARRFFGSRDMVWRGGVLGRLPELRPVGSERFVDALRGIDSAGSVDFISRLGLRAGVNRQRRNR